MSFFFPFIKNNEKKEDAEKNIKRKEKEDTSDVSFSMPLCSEIHIFKLIASCLGIFFFLMSNNFKIF